MKEEGTGHSVREYKMEKFSGRGQRDPSAVSLEKKAGVEGKGEKFVDNMLCSPANISKQKVSFAGESIEEADHSFKIPQSSNCFLKFHLNDKMECIKYKEKPLALPL